MDEPSSFFQRVKYKPSYCLLLRPFKDCFDKVSSFIVEEIKTEYECEDVKRIVKSGAIMSQIGLAAATVRNFTVAYCTQY